MRKLKLDPESIAVESFPTLAALSARGTVAAHGLAATPGCPLTQSDCQSNVVFCPSRVVSQCTCVEALC